jgi:hypothetical protein
LVAVFDQEIDCPLDFVGYTLARRLSHRPQLKILGSIVGSLSVFMVNTLDTLERSTENLLHDFTVLKDRLSASGLNSVPLARCASALARALRATSDRAESRAARPVIGASTVDDNAALYAIKSAGPSCLPISPALTRAVFLNPGKVAAHKNSFAARWANNRFLAVVQHGMSTDGRTSPRAIFVFAFLRLEFISALIARFNHGIISLIETLSVNKDCVNLKGPEKQLFS